MNFVDEGKNEGKYNKALRRYSVAFFGVFMGMLGLLIWGLKRSDKIEIG